MIVANVPELFQTRLSHRSNHDHNYGVAEAFHDYVDKLGAEHIKTPWTYLPIHWANNYLKQGPPYRPVPGLQEWLNNYENVVPDKMYFTVSRCDDGIYEDLPPNVFVFSACGLGDTAIPLTSELPLQFMHINSAAYQRRYFASFVGNVTCGGPDPTVVGRPKQSVWNANGIGTQLRRAMMNEFNGYKDCFIMDTAEMPWYEYIEVLKNSTFALCPRGYGRTSFRLYEAIACGAIPVYISDDHWMPYPTMPWDEFCVKVRPTQIKDLRHSILQPSRCSWKQRAQDWMKSTYETHFSLRGTCRQIHKRLEEYAK